MDDRVGDLRVVRHQSILDDVRKRVGVDERRVRRQPDVEVEEHVIGRAARADVMAADHAGNAHHDGLEIRLGDDDPIAQDLRRRGRDLHAGVTDEPRDDERRERVEDRPPQAGAGQRRDDRQRGPHVAARLQRVGQQHFAAQPPRLARFVADDPQVDRDRDDHDQEARARDLGRCASAGEVVERVAQDLEDDEQQDEGDAGGRDGLVLAMAVRMILVRRPLRRAHADEADEIGGGVGQRVKAVGKNADRAARVAERDLRDGDGEVEEEDLKKDAADGGETLDRGLESRGSGLDRRRSQVLFRVPSLESRVPSSKTPAPPEPATSAAAPCR